jgi:hypothetical protein
MKELYLIIGLFSLLGLGFLVVLKFGLVHTRSKKHHKGSPDIWSSLGYFRRFCGEKKVQLRLWARSYVLEREQGETPDLKPCVTMTSLGANGQFGNQLLQYMFLRIYALRFGRRIATPSWVGQLLFDLSDPLPENPGPKVNEKRDETEKGIFPETSGSVDFYGFFHFPTQHYAADREPIQRFLSPRREMVSELDEKLRALRDEGHTLVGLHLRVSTWDCGWGPFFIAPSEWYLSWLRELWSTLKKPVLFIATDIPENVLHHFKEYNPCTSKKLGLRSAISFFPDFYVLTQVDMLAISNSTFSFMASMLNQRAKTFMRPDNELKKLIPYDPWNSDPLLRATG